MAGDSTMRDDLRAQSLLRTEEPFSAWGFNRYGADEGGEVMDSLVLRKTNLSAPVDWLFVELRSAEDTASIVGTAAGVVLKNGRVTAPDGVSALSFSNVAADSVYIIVRHRNHLAVRTLSKYQTGKGVTVLNLADGSTPLLGGMNATKNINGLRCLIAGDANLDGTVNAVDRNLYWRLQNVQAYDYLSINADLNLDGEVNAIDRNLYWRINNSFSSFIR